VATRPRLMRLSAPERAMRRIAGMAMSFPTPVR
jgi:hypothetical protein